MTVGQVAARSGVAISTLHFYESKGLIRSRRSGGNQRRYSRDVLRRIGFIRVSQRVGISLDDIRRALEELPDNRTPTEQDWAHLAKTWREVGWRADNRSRRGRGRESERVQLVGKRRGASTRLPVILGAGIPGHGSRGVCVGVRRRSILALSISRGETVR